MQQEQRIKRTVTYDSQNHRLIFIHRGVAFTGRTLPEVFRKAGLVPGADRLVFRVQ